jgi:hypothetical protein
MARGYYAAFVALALGALLTGARASTGGAAGDAPPVTAGLQLWFEAESQPQADGQPVALWSDKSGLGRDLSSFDSGSAPVLRRGVVNGRAAVEFDGARSLLKTYGSSFTIAQPDTFFIVYKSLDPDTAGVRNFVFDSTNTSVRQAFGRSAPATMRMYANIDFDLGGIRYPFAGFQIWSGTFSGTASTLYRDGTLVLAGNSGNGNLNGFSLGALSTAAQYGYDYSHSLVSEVLVYSGSLTDTQRQSVTSWLDQKYAVTSAPSAPVSTAAPTVTGATVDGATLSTTTGTWTGTLPMTFAYQWQRCSSSGTSCVSLAGATASTYTVGPLDVGSTLKAIVTATNSLGSASAGSVASPVVGAAPPANTTLPSVSGTPVVGQSLTASSGTWSGSAPIAYAYEWRRCDSAGANCTAVATGTSYVLTNADVGSTLRIAVTASNSAGSATALSAATVVVAASNAPPVTAGLQMWFDAGQEAYADGSPVTRWTDRSGNGRDLTSFDSGSAATFRSNVVNGRPALEFDGARSLLKTYAATFTLAQPDTFFIVYRDLDTVEGYVFDSRNTSVRQLLGRASTGNLEMYADIPLSAKPTFPFAGFELWSGTFAGPTSTLYRNGAVAAQGNAGNGSLSGFTVGALSTSAQYGYSYSHSLVAEVLWYSGTLSATDRQAVTDWLNQKYGVISTQTPVAPANTAPPTIGGTPRDGSTLSATTGAWSGSGPLSYAYQWQRCAADGTGCVVVTGATTPTYTASAGDVGSSFRVAVTATNSVGSAGATSAPTAPVTAAPPANTVLPGVAGATTVGQSVTASTGTWTGTAPITYAYEWRRCDSSGATCAAVGTGASYTLVAGDAGSTLRAAVTATNGAGSTTAVSAPTAIVTQPVTGDSPPVTAGLQMWFDAGHEAYADGAAVLTWHDQSGNARDLTAFDSSAAPIFRRAAVNGRPVIEFDGVRSMLKTYASTFTIAQPDTFFVVYRDLAPAGSGSGFVFDSLNSSVRQVLGRNSGNDVEMYANRVVAVPTVVYPFPTFDLWSGTFNGDTSTLFRDGTQVGSGPAGSASLSTGFAVGGLSSSAQYGYSYGHVQVAEILWYSGALSAADRQAVTSWLQSRYASW